MTAKKWLTAFVGVAAAYWIYSKFRFSQSVTYVISRIGFGGSVLDPRINIDFTVYNPTLLETIKIIFYVKRQSPAVNLGCAS